MSLLRFAMLLQRLEIGARVRRGYPDNKFTTPIYGVGTRSARLAKLHHTAVTTEPGDQLLSPALRNIHPDVSTAWVRGFSVAGENYCTVP